ncbi:MAG: hypothetical protein QOE72_3385 [Chloroflexota bacterium]|jgi:hypothetical protein|nr:hypothetical protein [Chloroflexota bacterium]
MRHRITAHVRGNVVGYIALCAAFAGTSYAVVGLEPGSVRTTALENASVLRLQLAAQPVGGTNAGNGTAGLTDPAGAVGSGTIGASARLTSSLVATKGGSTDIPLTDNSWTQAADELELLAGTVAISIPTSCTGAFGNALTLSVDGAPTTFAVAPVPPTSGTVTMPFVIGTLSEPGRDTQHKLTAKFGNSCSKDGENYTVKDLRVDVLRFR